jgi:hypothetical protein
VNLTGYSARLQVRETPDSSVKLLDLTGSPQLVLGGAAGTVTLLLDAATTEALTLPGAYDLELQSSGGDVTRLLEGFVSVKRDVTR